MAILLIIACTALALAAEPTVDLGTTAGFAILAGSTITNTGTTTITGDVGLYPGSSFVSTGVTLIGAQHINDAVAIQAKTDLVAAYNDAAGRPVTGPVPVDLGGHILTPGVYSSGGVLGITGTLTLDAQGDPDAVFIFKSTATLITAANSQVVLINGARFCRVFWVVPSSATLGADSVFVGHILALTDIDVFARAVVEGQLLAQNGQVTLSSNLVTNEICEVVRTMEITKTATPTVLPYGGGSVIYTYTVTNPGTVEFSDVVVTDDKVATVTYVSGDLNEDGILQPSETWIYSATAELTETTTNVGTVTGTSPEGEERDTDTETVTVIPALPVGNIEITKLASPNTLPAGGGSVEYSYMVSTIGSVDVTSVVVTDDKINVVTYISGDVNEDGILQSTETWIYTATDELTETTTNVGTVTAVSAEGEETDVDVVTVTVAQSDAEDETVGERLPRTATPWYNLMLASLLLILVGAVGIAASRSHA